MGSCRDTSHEPTASVMQLRRVVGSLSDARSKQYDWATVVEISATDREMMKMPKSQGDGAAGYVCRDSVTRTCMIVRFFRSNTIELVNSGERRSHIYSYQRLQTPASDSSTAVRTIATQPGGLRIAIRAICIDCFLQGDALRIERTCRSRYTF